MRQGPDTTLVERPSWWFAIIPRFDTLAISGLLIGAWIVVRVLWPDAQHKGLFAAGVALLLVDFVRGLLITLLYRYELTPTHVRSRVGIIARRTNEIALARVQHVEVRQSVVQRVLGCGSVDAAAADGLPVSWIWVDQPDHLASVLRAAIARAGGATDQVRASEASSASSLPFPTSSRSSTAMHTSRFKSLGLVGGIGAGKSAVARILGDLGYLVLDADKDAKAALDRPDVRGFLIGWWGSQIVGSDGKVDRKKVGEIVFSRPEERRKLEALVHPIVRADRSLQIAEARREGRPGVVIDAPLLFEAKSEGDCDSVLFIDTPRDVRVRRVLQRGWTIEDLERREAAQLPLDEKRRRANVVIVNDGDLEDLRAQVLAALTQV